MEALLGFEPIAFYSTDEVLDRLSKVTDFNDSIFVANMSDASWRGLSAEVQQFIQEQWWK